MKLITRDKDNNILEFDEEMDIKHLDYRHNEFFLDLLDMCDRLRFTLSDAIDYRDNMNNRICSEDNDSILDEWKVLEKEAIELLTNICK